MFESGLWLPTIRAQSSKRAQTGFCRLFSKCGPGAQKDGGNASEGVLGGCARFFKSQDTPADPVRIPSKWQCGGAGVAVGQHRRHGRCSGVHVHPAAGCAAPAPRHAGPSTTPTTICMQVAATVVQWSSTQGPVLVPSGACISRGSQGSAVPSASAGADHEAPVAVVAVVTVVAPCPAPKCRRRGPRWRWCPRESRDPPSPVSITEC